MPQDKARSAANGCSIGKGCNAVLGHLGVSLRARREAAIRGVAPLAKGATLAHETRLAADSFSSR
jgi:hypothetical protein